MEHLWSRAGATRGNRWQTEERENGSNRRKPLRSVATSCRSERMVRRGSTVRVRQRALVRGKSPEIGDLCCLNSTTEHLRITVGTAIQLAARPQSPCKSTCCPVPRSTSLRGRGRQSSSPPRPAQNGLDKRHVARTRARGASRASL